MSAHPRLAAQVRDSLRLRVPRCDPGHISVRVDSSGTTIDVAYRLPDARVSRDHQTRLELSLNLQRRLLWIKHLEVAPHQQGHGLGQTLMRAAEGMAQELRLCRVQVYPLSGAIEFWTRAGYRPHPTIARVLMREVRPQSSSV